VVGNYINYVVTVTNNGPSNGTSATLNDTLSSELQNATFCVDTATTCDPSTGSAWTGSTSVGALASGDSKVVRIRAQIKPGSTATSITNQAHLAAQSPTDPISTNDDSAVVTTTLSREADLAVTKTGPTSAVVGNYINYVVTVTNNGPSNGTSATLNDTLSSELQNATFCVDTATTCDPSTGSAWTGSTSVGALASGDSKVVRIRAQIKPGSTATSITNQAHLAAQSPTDPISTNDDSAVVTTTLSREADLAVTKTGPTSAVVGNYINYVVTVTNNGPSNGTSATLNDTLSSELQNATFCVDTATTCDPSTGSAWTGSTSVGALASGDSKVVRIRAQIKPGSTATSITNQAHLAAQSPTDPISTNDDSAVVTTTLSREADLAVTKTGPTSAVVGNYINYVVTVTNNGPSNSTSATLNDTLSSELQNATFCVDTATTCDPSTGSAWTGSTSVGALASGDSKVVRIRAQIKPGSTATSITNQAHLAAQSPTDPLSTNADSAVVTTTLSREADLAVT